MLELHCEHPGSSWVFSLDSSLLLPFAASFGYQHYPLCSKETLCNTESHPPVGIFGVIEITGNY